jgi:hypothetical protein
LIRRTSRLQSAFIVLFSPKCLLVVLLGAFVMTTVQDIQGYVHDELAHAASDSEHIPEQLQTAHHAADTEKSEIEAARDAALAHIGHLGVMLNSLEHQLQDGESRVLPALGEITRDVHALTVKLTALPEALEQLVNHESDAATASVRQLQGTFEHAETDVLAHHTPPTVALLEQGFPTLTGQIDHLLTQSHRQVVDVSSQAQAAIETVGLNTVPNAKQQVGDEVTNGHQMLADALDAKTADLIAVHGAQHGELSKAVDDHTSDLRSTHDDAVGRITDQLGQIRNVIDTIKPVVQIASLI